MKEKHVTLRDMACVLSPGEPAPPELLEHIKSCDRCLKLFDGLTLPEERGEAGTDADPCPMEPEVYGLYFGVEKESADLKERLAQIHRRTAILRHIRECDFCSEYIEYLTLSAGPSAALSRSPREAAAGLVRESARVCVDFLGALLGHVPQPQYATAMMAVGNNRRFLFRFPFKENDAVLSYKPEEGSFELICPDKAKAPPDITVYADGKKTDGGWSVAEPGRCVRYFSTGSVVQLCVAGCPVIQTVPYNVLSHQANVVGNIP